MKIRQMLFFLLFVCSVAPMLLISAWNVRASDAKLEALLEENLRGAAAAQVQALQWFFSQMDHSLMVVSSTNTVWTMLEASNREDLAEVQRLRPFIDDLLTAQMHEYTYIESVTLLDKNFRIISCSVPVETWKESKLKKAPYRYVEGQTFFTSIVPAKFSSHNKEVFGGIRPIYDNGVCIGYIIDELNCSYFEQMREGMQAVETGVLYLTDDKGGLVTAGNHELTREEYRQRSLDTADFQCEWQAAQMAEKENGFLRYVSGGDTYITYYHKLPSVGWRIFVSSNLARLTAKENTIRDLVLLYCFLFTVLLIWSNYLISRRIAKPVENLIEQVQQIKRNFGLRIRRMPNNEIGKFAAEFNALLDCIEQNNRELWRSREKYNIVLNESNHIFIERDYHDGTWIVSKKFEEIFGYPFPFDKLKQLNDFAEYVHSDDRRAYGRWVIQSFKSDERMQTEIRVRKWTGEFLWSRIMLSPIFDEEGQVVASIGLMADIDQEHQEKERLQEIAQLDPLTNLLNKGALQEALCRQLERCSSCAVLFIDIDDFKEYNTKYGHLQGDEVLKFVAVTLRRCLGALVGRNGGDEFVACLSENVQLEQKIKALIAALEAGFELAESGVHVQVRCSIGAVLYPQGAASYKELLRRADDAMYTVKNHGKNNFYIIGE